MGLRIKLVHKTDQFCRVFSIAAKVVCLDPFDFKTAAKLN